MDNTCETTKTEPVLLAVTRATFVPEGEVPRVITSMFDIVYGWLPDSGVEQCGHNHAIYRHAKDGMRMQVGFPVSERFTDTDQVECLQFLGRRAAHITHRGDYGGIPDAYAALHAWCRDEGLELAGLNWEVYGDWRDDPAELTTDIYLSLA